MDVKLILPDSVKNEANSAINALVAFNQALDTVLEQLDVATEHYQYVILPTEIFDDEVEKIVDPDELMIDINTYVMLTAYLLDHPLIQVMRQIREESAISDDDTAMLAIKSNLKVGQKFRHYKGGTYLITSIARDANNPQVKSIHYSDGVDTWCLNIAEFSKRVKHDDIMVNRFQLIAS